MSVGILNRYGLSFGNVVGDGTASNNITVGRTLETVSLKLGGTTFTKAMIEQVRFKANGKTILDATGEQLQAINAYRGDPEDAAYLDIQFSDFTGQTEFDKQVGAFDTTVGIGNITTEVKIAGATAPQLTALLRESARSRPSEAAYAGMMCKLLSYPFNISVGGRLPVSFPFGPSLGAIIKRVHVFHSGNMTGATVKQDGMPIHEKTLAENEREQDRFGRVPQANVYTLDFVLDGSIGKALNTRDAKSLEWLFDFSAADNGTILVEYLDVLGNL
ncbi:MAG TPA: major capsid protein P2 [Aromatoleum sp.]|uniref:major capsid protein P2 n=1 Tax=Aromatoleum sp. TaxID=2307007 RepID=UPI002B46D401|nr:major capsid protein P2 [Aromatoleum sp.]HJV24569.1 major capsid protein P2 [Aromatoleum sp.]